MSELPASTLLHPDVLEEPYDLYRTFSQATWSS